MCEIASISYGYTNISFPFPNFSSIIFSFSSANFVQNLHLELESLAFSYFDQFKMIPIRRNSARLSQATLQNGHKSSQILTFWAWFFSRCENASSIVIEVL